MIKALTDFDVDSLATQFTAWGQKASHAAPLLRKLYNSSGDFTLADCKLGRALAARIETEIPLRQSRVEFRSESADGTVKVLVGFKRGGAAEAVLMPAYQAERAAGCVSSQIGCAMGCDFCASTKTGLERNLESGEIVEQFLHLRREAIQSGRRLSTLVFMGMGEPLQNLENVIAAIKRIAGEGMGALGWRQITVSTVGIVPGIYALADANLNVNLALSLHAPDDETRSRIVPLNKRYPVAEIMAATKSFYQRTRRITNIEYCLLAGINDSDRHAHALAELLKGFRTHVNLIPYNSIGRGLSGIVYEQPPPERIEQFRQILAAERVVTHVRRSRGEDVNAACGQLWVQGSKFKVQSLASTREP